MGGKLNIIVTMAMVCNRLDMPINVWKWLEMVKTMTMTMMIMIIMKSQMGWPIDRFTVSCYIYCILDLLLHTIRKNLNT